MSFKLDEEFLEKACEFALKATADTIKNEIILITPRDKKRLPINTINRKDGKKPIRIKAHFKPINIGWNWFEWVSGQLKKSIETEKINKNYYKIWVTKWPASEYWKFLEFWTVNMKPRSFLRKWLYDNSEKAKKIFQKAFKLYIKNKTKWSN